MSIFTSLSGMMVHLFRQDVTAHNLANVNTTGYKSSRAELKDLLGMGGAQVAATSRDHSQGAFLSTERTMDMAVEGRGLFPLKTPDGGTAYTRDGTFHIDVDGNIVNSNGYILDADITVPENASGLRISPDGFIFATLENGGTQELGRISLANFFNPQGLSNAGDNLYHQTAASGPAVFGYPGANGFGTVLSGNLETSNVSIIKEMTDMIINQRGMEANLKAVQTHDAMFGTVLDMKR